MIKRRGKEQDPASDRARRDAEWMKRATAESIRAARDVVKAIPPNVPVGRLQDQEWGWFVAAIVFAWIRVRAEQATSAGLEMEDTIRTVLGDQQPWDHGAIATILPRLATEAKIDWARALNDWSKDEMIGFLGLAFSLMLPALVARDDGSLDCIERIYRQTGASDQEVSDAAVEIMERNARYDREHGASDPSASAREAALARMEAVATRTAREINASVGNGLITGPAELDDEIPF